MADDVVAQQVESALQGVYHYLRVDRTSFCGLPCVGEQAQRTIVQPWCPECVRVNQDELLARTYGTKKNAW